MKSKKIEPPEINQILRLNFRDNYDPECGHCFESTSCLPCGYYVIGEKLENEGMQDVVVKEIDRDLVKVIPLNGADNLELLLANLTSNLNILDNFEGKYPIESRIDLAAYAESKLKILKEEYNSLPFKIASTKKKIIENIPLFERKLAKAKSFYEDARNRVNNLNLDIEEVKLTERDSILSIILRYEKRVYSAARHQQTTNRLIEISRYYQYKAVFNNELFAAVKLQYDIPELPDTMALFDYFPNIDLTKKHFTNCHFAACPVIRAVEDYAKKKKNKKAVIFDEKDTFHGNAKFLGYTPFKLDSVKELVYVKEI